MLPFLRIFRLFVLKFALPRFDTVKPDYCFTNTHLIRTPHYHGQLTLCLRKESPYIISKFSPLNYGQFNGVWRVATEGFNSKLLLLREWQFCATKRKYKRVRSLKIHSSPTNTSLQKRLNVIYS